MTTCHDISSWQQKAAVPSVRFRHIVVGIDGSQNSLAALKLAVGIGGPHGAKVEAVCVYHPNIQAAYPFSSSTALPPYGPPGEGTRQMYASPGGVIDAAAEALETLENAVTAVFGQQPPDNLILRPIDGSPHEVLTKVSESADLLVVGARGHSGAIGLLLGSTAQSCTRHATCPVLVVPAQRAAPAEAAVTLERSSSPVRVHV